MYKYIGTANDPICVTNRESRYMLYKQCAFELQCGGRGLREQLLRCLEAAIRRLFPEWDGLYRAEKVRPVPRSQKCFIEEVEEV